MIECADETRRVLIRHTESLIEILGDGLVGIYLHGSLARGCYHPTTSDIDTIVVLKDRCKEPDTPAILKVHQDAGIPIDAVFVTESQINTDRFPTPVEFLVKPISDSEIFHLPEGSKDFLLQRQDAYETGAALAGPTTSKMMRPVPWPLLAESLNYLLPHIVPHFKNSMLMLCRIAYAWTFHKLCSKREAGEWASDVFGADWKPFIEAALADYANGKPSAGAAQAKLQEFEEFCARYIKDLEIPHRQERLSP